MLNEYEGAKIKARIKAIGITQKVLAKVAGVWAPELSLALRGQHVPDHVGPAVTRAVNDLEDLLRTPNSRIPNLRNAADIEKSFQNLAEIRAKESTPHRALVFESPATA